MATAAEPPPPLLVIATGGTIFQKVNPATGAMEIRATVEDVTSGLTYPPGLTHPLPVHYIPVRTGAEVTFEAMLAVRDVVLQNPHSAFLLITGTDTMDEFAFFLSLVLQQHLLTSKHALVITGAMKPADIPGFDGASNIQDSLRVACSAEAKACGVLVVLNDSIHLAAYVRKGDSQLIGSFRSHPGPIGQIRSGRPVFYYAPPQHPAGGQPDFSGLELRDLRSRVCIWTVTVSAFIPEELLEAVDGLVIAGAGTGSLPSSMIEQLAKWTHKLPMVIVSRCETGNNFEDSYYRGSRQRYTSRGFLLDEYEQLNAVQARLRLICQISKQGVGAYLQQAQRTQNTEEARHS